MTEYPIQANVSVLEFEVIKEMRNVEKNGWGGILLNWQSKKCIQFEVKHGKERDMLLGWQK